MQTLPVVAIAAAIGGVLWMSFRDDGWLAAESTEVLRGAEVQRGPMRITVIERGNLKAADSVSVKNEIEGRTTILKLVEEGIHVQEGDLLCELDVTSLIDQRFQQEISLRNAEASFVKSRQNLEIQKSQNESDIKSAEQKLQFAEMDLRKFREGERLAREAEADESIKLAEEEATRAGEKLAWSRRLNDKGFLTDTELEADQLSLSRAQIQLEQAKRDKDLLIRFQIPRDEADLESKLEEANRELERVKLQADARLVDYEADMNTNEAKLQLEREKLAKIETQISKSKLYAPRAGMVVYASEDGGRWGDDSPISEGTEVRERQEIITIPSAKGMIAEVSLHESVLKQVEIGQRAIVRVDAIPGREFEGRVRFVAVMADQQSRWLNPNLRLYRTDVQLEGAAEEMRPGMSCAIEIEVEDIEDTLYVPVQCVVRRGEETLAFVDRDGSVEERHVEVGRYNDRWVEILEGLEEGEIVLLAPPPDFSREAQEGQKDEAGPRARPEGDTTVAGESAPERPRASSREGGRPEGAGRERGAPEPGGRADATADQTGERPQGFDPARAEEMRKRWEGMSEEDRKKAMEAFRGGGGRGEGG